MTTSTSEPRRKMPRLSFGRMIGEDFWLLLLIALFVLGFWAMLGPRFLSVAVLRSMALQLPELGLLSLAMMVALLSGGINLSIISSAVLAGITAALIMSGADAGGAPSTALVWLAVAAGIAAAVVVGLVNGFLISHVGVSPILATLASMMTVDGLNLLLTGGRSISGMPAAIRVLADGTAIGIPLSMIVFLVCAAAMAFLLTRTTFGLSIYMIGSNKAATHLAGVNTRTTIMGVYALSGALAGIAGIVMLARFNSMNSGFGDFYLLVTILAAVLGGVDPFGGFGRVRGLLIALVVLQVISSGFNMLHLSAHTTLAIWGALLLVVMSIRVLLGARAR
jgi:simple sugar transport system permease protein